MLGKPTAMSGRVLTDHSTGTTLPVPGVQFEAGMDFNPLWISVTVGLVAVVFWIGWWASKMNAGERDFRTFAERVGDELHSVKDDIRVIKAQIVNIFERIPVPKTLGAMSPLQLNELGEKVEKELDGRVWASRIAPGMTESVKGMEPLPDRRVQRTVRLHAIGRRSRA